jgi:hypothetical protein
MIMNWNVTVRWSYQDMDDGVMKWDANQVRYVLCVGQLSGSSGIERGCGH